MLRNETVPIGKKPKNIRTQNKKLIIDLYRTHEALSVSVIARKIRLSRTTVMIINDELLQEGTISEAGKGDSTDEGGKKPLLYKFNAMRQLVLAFHIKYDRISFSISDLRYNSLIKDELPLELDEPFWEIGMKMKELIEMHRQQDKSYLACIVGIHGNVDSETGICIHSTYFSSWGSNNNLKEQLESILPVKCPIILDSWLRLKTYGENKLGLARNYNPVVVIDAGWHGVGAGILLNGSIYSGRHALSGEIGHIRVNWEDREVCKCGNHGCFEQQISTGRLRSHAAEFYKNFPETELSKDFGHLQIKDVIKAANAKDKLALRLVDEVVHWFTVVLSQIIMFFDPEIIIIEGDYASGCPYMENKIKTQITELAFPRIMVHKTSIMFNNKEIVTPLKGAAVYGIDKFYT